MSHARDDAEAWIEAVRDGACRVSPILGLSHCEVLTRIKVPPKGLSGMAVALRGSCAHVRIGVLTNSTGRGELARALLRMDPAESPSERDENDALGELTNVITGHVKVVMSTIDGTMRIGLPAHVNTDAFLESSEQITLRVSFGGVPAALVVTMLVP